jgi:hypothetical protein
MKSRCAAGYSIDACKNIQVSPSSILPSSCLPQALHDELDAIDPSSAAGQATMQLLRAWNWVDRVEQLHQADYSLNLSNCGILQLLLKDSQTTSRSAGELLPPSLPPSPHLTSPPGQQRITTPWR